MGIVIVEDGDAECFVLGREWRVFTNIAMIVYSRFHTVWERRFWTWPAVVRTGRSYDIA